MGSSQGLLHEEPADMLMENATILFEKNACNHEMRRFVFRAGRCKKRRVRGGN
jgi:hypothetical protein